MSLNVFNFDKYDGIAETENQGDYEMRIYLKGKCNVETAICTRVVEKGTPTFYLYNFIVDKDHLKNMKDMNWFKPINKITLYVDKVDGYLAKFISYALKNKVEVHIITKPF